jgi:hypothetical protein
VLDAADPRLAVLQAHAARSGRVKPLIPLGTRGTWHGHPYEVVGLQQRAISVEGTSYSWREYLLFNPYHGFRYLTEYDGHWNDVVTLPGLPQREESRGRPSASLQGEHYRHFQRASATTTFVLGEFPWQVRLNDIVTVNDFVAPPRLLSAESTREEETWSLGEYVEGKAVWKAFGLEGRPPAPRGTYANQPSPLRARIGPMWRTFALLALLVLGACGWRQATARREVVFAGSYAFRAQPGDDSAFVTDAFDLRGGEANVQIVSEADVQNDWIFLEYALIDEASGRAWELGRTVSYYTGRDADGAWSEGARTDRARIPSVPAGRYYLRVKPEGEAGRTGPVFYKISVRRDVPSPLLPGLALLLLLVPPLATSIRHWSFEHHRWLESDYPPTTASDVTDALSEDE